MIAFCLLEKNLLIEIPNKDIQYIKLDSWKEVKRI